MMVVLRRVVLKIDLRGVYVERRVLLRGVDLVRLVDLVRSVDLVRLVDLARRVIPHVHMFPEPF